MEKQKFYWLDLIRFIAAVLVVAVHVRSDFFMTYSELPAESKNIITQLFYFINSFGFDAVVVFFVLSGFLVGGKNLARLQHDSGISIKQYAINRFFRIGVPLVSSLILIIIVDLLVGKKSNWIGLLGNLVALQGILVQDEGGVFWTLSYEVWFYILIGGLLLVLKNSSRKVLGFILLAVSLAAFMALINYFLYILAFGILAYYLKDFRINRSFLLLIVFLAGVITILSHLAAPSKARDVSIYSWINRDMLVVLYGLIISILMSQVVYMKPKIKILSKIEHSGTFLASFSYTLYLTHYQVIRLMHYMNFEIFNKVSFYTVLMFSLQILICIIFAYLFYLLTEKQTNKIKSFFLRK